MSDSQVCSIIEKLGLIRHPEGGWFRESYRADGSVPLSGLPGRSGGDRPYSTAIYFLLNRGEVSRFHRILSDELWHFHAGTQLTIHILAPDGEYRSLAVGPDLSGDDSFQAVVPAGCWFGAEVTGVGAFTLVSCTVAPGFDFADFELADRDDLLRRYPEHGELVRRLTPIGS